MKCLLTVVCFFISFTLFAQKQNAKPFTADISVCNIYLEDERTTTKILGRDIWNKHFEADSMLPRIECVNKSGTQGLRLLFHYGGTKNAVAQFELFEIKKGYKKPAKAVVFQNCDFKSGNKIMLGMDRQRLISIIGKNFKSSRKKNVEQIRYYTNDANAEILKKYDAVGYFIECRFKNNKLVNYSFGFEYP